jgi:hypothetical protein
MQEEFADKQDPDQGIAAAEDEKAKAAGQGHILVGPEQGINHRDNQGKGCPQKPGKV